MDVSSASLALVRKLTRGKSQDTPKLKGDILKEFDKLDKDKDGKLLACNAHKKGEPCKAGVAAGQGLDAHVGKCAYDHP